MRESVFTEALRGQRGTSRRSGACAQNVCRTERSLSDSSRCRFAQLDAMFEASKLHRHT
jgi:hypothetical protein